MVAFVNLMNEANQGKTETPSTEVKLHKQMQSNRLDDYITEYSTPHTVDLQLQLS